jgi:hypothetical protein
MEEYWKKAFKSGMRRGGLGGPQVPLVHVKQSEKSIKNPSRVWISSHTEVRRG